MPAVGMCLECHKADKVPKPALLALDAEKPLAWDPALRLPDHVFFSHARHVDVAGLECLECHEDMPTSARPPETRRVIAMNDCIGCHEHKTDKPAAQAATIDCARCHR